MPSGSADALRSFDEREDVRFNTLARRGSMRLHVCLGANTGQRNATKKVNSLKTPAFELGQICVGEGAHDNESGVRIQQN